LPVEAGSGLTATAGQVTVMIRPEQLEIVASQGAAEHLDGLAGRVVACEYYGHDAVVRVGLDGLPAGQEVIVRTSGGPQLPAGAPVLVRAHGPVIAWTRG
jgi:hypothetical protein